MKRIMLTIYGLSWVMFASAQGGDGFGRGLDWDEAPSINFTTLFLFILVVIVIIAIVGKIREKIKLATGKYVKVVRNGYISASSIDDYYTQPFQIIQTWKLKEFENTFGTFIYNEEKIDESRKKLISITCTNGLETVVIGVGFRSVISAQFIIDNYKVFRVAKVKNGKYLLCHK